MGSSYPARVRTIHLLFALAPMVLVIVLTLLGRELPSPLPVGSPADVFSAERAIEDVRGLTGTGLPHPAARYDGTKPPPEQVRDHERARDFVIKRLRELGLSPSIQRGFACGRYVCADVENIVARAFEEAEGPAVMLAAHYDSTQLGPGASDDGAGVAAILETVRALLTGPAPKRPLVILIDDGEEVGLLGAKVFVRDHPWAKDVGVVLNFEARGSRGQVAMFETSANNGWLIDTYARSVDRPAASSVIYSLYERLPNDTDLTVFKQAGMQGLNFAFADGLYDYHTANDTVDRLDRGSLQHMGDQALSVSRALLFADSIAKPEPDAVYFDVFSWGVVRYSSSITRPLAVLSALFAAYSLWLLVRKKRTTAARIALGAAVAVGALLASGAASLLLQTLLRKIRFPNAGTGPSAMRIVAGDTNVLPSWLAVVAVGVATSLAFSLLLCPRAKPEGEAPTGGKKADSAALFGGLLALFGGLSLLVGWTVPGASYLFTWPVFGLSGAVASLAVRPEPSPLRRAASSAIVLGVGALLWIPIVYVLLVMVGANLPIASALPAALLSLLVVPLLLASPSKLRWALPVSAGAATLAFAIVASRIPGEGPHIEPIARAPIGAVEPVEITVLGTSDLHGRLSALPLLGGYVEAARATNPGGVVVVDAGDMFQGTLESNENEGAAVIEAYKKIGYDAVAIGNHEFDYGPAGPRSVPNKDAKSEPEGDPRGALKARALQARGAFPLLAANLLEDGKPLDYPNVAPSVMVTKNGVSVGLIGVSTMHTPRTTIAANVVGITMKPIAEAIAEEARSLRQRGAKLIVVMAHAGGECKDLTVPSDLSSCDAEAEIFEVARALPPGVVNVIVAGHTHKAIAHEIAGIAIIQSNAYGTHVGRVDLAIDAQTGRVLRTRISGPLSMKGEPVLDGKRVAAKRGVEEAISPALDEARARRGESLNTVVAGPFPAKYREECALGNLVTSLLLDTDPNMDIAIANGGGLRADIAPGELTYGALYDTLPFDNRIARVTMTGRQLRDTLTRNFTGKSGIFSIAGARVEGRCEEGELALKIVLSKGERELSDEDIVRVMTNEFLATRGDGFGPGEKVEIDEEGPVLREPMAALLKERRGTLRPEEWLVPGKPRIALPGPTGPSICGK